MQICGCQIVKLGFVFTVHSNHPSIHPFILKSSKEPIQYIHVDKNRREKKKNKQMNNTKNTHTRYEPNQMLSIT